MNRGGIVMAYKRKTRDVWQVEVNYGFGHGWEYQIAEYSIVEARKRLREYRENCQYPSRMRKTRERIP
jgi:hypothetical protein